MNYLKKRVLKKYNFWDLVYRYEFRPFRSFTPLENVKQDTKHVINVCYYYLEYHKYFITLKRNRI
jgi:hypothetical protein